MANTERLINRVQQRAAVLSAEPDYEHTSGIFAQNLHGCEMQIAKR